MFVGIDHSTTGMKVAVVDEDGERTGSFKIERSADDPFDWSFLDILADHVAVEDVEMAAIGYSYGDGFSSITDIESIEGRGVVDHIGAGHSFGTGTLVYDELKRSAVPTVCFPGVHDDLPSLHPYFRHYSNLTGADKVAMTRYAKRRLDEWEGGADHFIAANTSSSSMATLVQDGEIRGAFTWLALIHAHPDMEMLRRLRDGDQDYHDCYMQSGVLAQRDYDFEAVKGTPDPELLEMAYWATLNHVYACLPFARHVHDDPLEAIVLSGRLSRIEDPIDVRGRLTDTFEDIAPTHVSERFGTATGAALIARDAAVGADDVLGIPVGEVPRRAEVSV
ncbi:methanogenesis marker 12 protein [Haloarcula sp. S1AR25-4]|uniref:methanogenesis marker 12 protein n=1 Tax=Haloarcula sp. S1AR25-4 TaxID=2950538 RepID=UPI00287BB3A6|nr:methanogenesis marker 12 protein [Halomicroarcula sp. S1AR25-4]